MFIVMRPGIFVRTTRTPVLNGTFQLINRFYGKLCAARSERIGSRNCGFCVYFWMIKGMNLQNNNVGGMVYHSLMSYSS